MTRNTAGRALVATLVVLVGAAVGLAQEPRPGTVQRLPAITVSMQVGSMEKETKQVTYSPPPGWYVRSHVVSCGKKTGNTSYTVSTVPQNWAWGSEAKFEESYKALVEMAEKTGDQGLQAKILTEQRQTLAELRKVMATHHALVVEASVKGEGWMRTGGSLELTVTAELVYVGTTESLCKRLSEHSPAQKR